jgi:hypothetical protein
MFDDSKCHSLICLSYSPHHKHECPLPESSTWPLLIALWDRTVCNLETTLIAVECRKNTPRYGQLLLGETVDHIEKILDGNEMPNEHEEVHAIVIRFGSD